MNIYDLNPPFHKKFSRSQRSPAVIKSGVIYYPIWLAYATGVLEKAGFKKEGSLRKALWNSKGTWSHGHLYSLIREEWQEQKY